MSATIFSPPSQVPVPSFNFRDVIQAQKDEDKFISDLKALLLIRKTGKNIGEVINFQVADGHARYMIASMKPLELVHLPLGDAWEFQYAHLLTATAVQEQLDRQTALKKLFSKKA